MHKLLKDTLHKDPAAAKKTAEKQQHHGISLRQGAVIVMHYVDDYRNKIRAALQPAPKMSAPVVEFNQEANDLLNTFFERALANQREILDLGSEPGSKTAYARFQEFLRKHYPGQEPRDLEVWSNFRQHLLQLNRLRSPTLQAGHLSHLLYRLVLSNPSVENVAIISEVLPYKNAQAILDLILKCGNIIDWDNPEVLTDQKIGLRTLVNTLLLLIDDKGAEEVLNAFSKASPSKLTSRDFQTLAHSLNQKPSRP